MLTITQTHIVELLLSGVVGLLLIVIRRTKSDITVAHAKIRALDKTVTDLRLEIARDYPTVADVAEGTRSAIAPVSATLADQSQRMVRLEDLLSRVLLGLRSGAHGVPG